TSGRCCAAPRTASTPIATAARTGSALRPPTPIGCAKSATSSAVGGRRRADLLRDWPSRFTVRYRLNGGVNASFYAASGSDWAARRRACPGGPSRLRHAGIPPARFLGRQVGGSSERGRQDHRSLADREEI